MEELFPVNIIQWPSAHHRFVGYVDQTHRSEPNTNNMFNMLIITY